MIIFLHPVCMATNMYFGCSSFHIRLGTFPGLVTDICHKTVRLYLLNLLHSFTRYLDAWRQTADVANITKAKSYQKQLNNMLHY
jgi:hypothetical protein